MVYNNVVIKFLVLAGDCYFSDGNWELCWSLRGFIGECLRKLNLYVQQQQAEISLAAITAHYKRLTTIIGEWQSELCRVKPRIAEIPNSIAKFFSR